MLGAVLVTILFVYHFRKLISHCVVRGVLAPYFTIRHGKSMHKFWKNFEISDKGLFEGTVFRKSAAAKCNFYYLLAIFCDFQEKKFLKVMHAAKKVLKIVRIKKAFCDSSLKLQVRKYCFNLKLYLISQNCFSIRRG